MHNNAAAKFLKHALAYVLVIQIALSSGIVYGNLLGILFPAVELSADVITLFEQKTGHTVERSGSEMGLSNYHIWLEARPANYLEVTRNYVQETKYYAGKGGYSKWQEVKRAGFDTAWELLPIRTTSWNNGSWGYKYDNPQSPEDLAPLRNMNFRGSTFSRTNIADQVYLHGEAGVYHAPLIPDYLETVKQGMSMTYHTQLMIQSNVYSGDPNGTHAAINGGTFPGKSKYSVYYELSLKKLKHLEHSGDTLPSYDNNNGEIVKKFYRYNHLPTTGYKEMAVYLPMNFEYVASRADGHYARFWNLTRHYDKDLAGTFSSGYTHSTEDIVEYEKSEEECGLKSQPN